MQKGDRKKEKEKEKETETKEKRKREKKELYRLLKKNDSCANFRFSIYVRVNPILLTQFFTLTLYKSYCLGFFTCEPNTVTGHYESRPYNNYWKYA